MQNLVENRKIVFRLDYGGMIGLGHLARCSYLSRALVARGFETHLALNATQTQHPHHAQKFLDCFSHSIAFLDHESSARDSSESFLELVERIKPLVTVVDHYGVTDDLLHRLRQLSPVMAISDGIKYENVDYILEYGSTDQGDKSKVNSPKFRLSGIEFALVTALDEFKLSVPTIMDTEVAISLGGGANKALVERVSERLQSSGLAGSGLVVAAAENLTLNPSSTFTRLDLRQNREGSLRQILSRSRRAIVSGGVSLLESMAQGVPAVALVTAENQLSGLEVLRRNEHIMIAKDLGFFRSHQFLNWWERYESDSERKRAELSLRATVDSMGPRRVSLELGVGGESELMLRLATEADIPILFRWRNDSGPMVHLKAVKTVSEQEHMDWYTSLAKEKASLWIAELAGVPVGQVRLQNTQTFSALEISYSVDRIYRGRGFGRKMIEIALSQPTLVGPVWARVHPQNTASAKILLANGFVSVRSNLKDFNVYRRA